MGFQPQEEKDAERALLQSFAEKMDSTVIKSQSDNDDGGTDGVILLDGVEIDVEVRRKGYPNHSGRTTSKFYEGWDTKFLKTPGKEGIILNERTIKNHVEKGFLFVVEINHIGRGPDAKYCNVTPERVQELLNMPAGLEKSQNSGSMQVVRYIPLEWFETY